MMKAVRTSETFIPTRLQKARHGENLKSRKTFHVRGFSCLYAILRTTCRFRSRGSSVSTVSCYGLDDLAIGVRSPAEAKNFSSILCVQTGSGAHPASCKKGTGGTFPGGKARPGCDAYHLPPSSAEVVNE
jgi:hypothetical protein